MPFNAEVLFKAGEKYQVRWGKQEEVIGDKSDNSTTDYHDHMIMPRQFSWCSSSCRMVAEQIQFAKDSLLFNCYLKRGTYLL